MTLPPSRHGSLPLGPMIEVRAVDRHFTCEHGRVGELRSEAHGAGAGRLCIHTREVPMVFAITREVVDSLHWQPRLFTRDPRNPCIASIRNGIVTLAFDALGPVPVNEAYTAHHREAPAYLYHYRLHPLKWWDEPEPEPDLLLAVRVSWETPAE